MLRIPEEVRLCRDVALRAGPGGPRPGARASGRSQNRRFDAACCRTRCRRPARVGTGCRRCSHRLSGSGSVPPQAHRARRGSAGSSGLERPGASRSRARRDRRTDSRARQRGGVGRAKPERVNCCGARTDQRDQGNQGRQQDGESGVPCPRSSSCVLDTDRPVLLVRSAWRSPASLVSVSDSSHLHC
jgi:hypothetical protein